MWGDIMDFTNIIWIVLIVFFVFGIIEYICIFISYNTKSDEKKYLFKTSIVSFFELFFVTVPKRIYKIIELVVDIILSPIHILEILSENLAKEKWKNVFLNISRYFKSIFAIFIGPIKNWYEYVKKRNESKIRVEEQIRTFYSCIAEYLQTDDPLKQNHATFKLIGIAIFLLQFLISFATTLAGAKLIFGSITSYAPWVFTLVVQGLIVVFSQTAFQRNRKRKKFIIALTLCVLVSVFFSYTGIVVAQDSPLDTYKSAYTEYEANFNKIKSDLTQNESDMNIIDNELKKLKSNKDLISSRIGELNQLITANNSIINTLRKNLTGTDRYVSGDGRTITKSVISNEVKESMDTYTDQNNGYNNELTLLNEFINNYNDFFNETESDAKRIYEESKNTETVSGTVNKLKNLISSCNIINKQGNISGLQLMDENLFDKIANNLEINDINITSSEDIFGSDKNSKSLDNSEKEEFWPISFFSSIFDAAISDQISNVSEKRNKILENVGTSYAKLTPFASDDMLKTLDVYKENVQKLPNVFSYSLRIPFDGNRDILDFVIMFLIALLIDVGSALLGYVKQIRNTSFVYVKSSKDYYNEYDDIFEVLFISLMRSQENKITNGAYINQSYNDFKESCLNIAFNTSSLINDFLKCFELSKGTWKAGYNLKCKLDEINEKKFLPLISIMTKTGMACIISTRQYDILIKNNYAVSKEELEFINIDMENIDDNSNYYLIIRNRGENFLREKMPFKFNIETGDGRQ